MPRTRELFVFIKERHDIYLRRKSGKSRPWTKDPILQRYRFCNMYRELDKVTIWIRQNWRDPHASDLHLWFAMVVARMVNWPATLDAIGYPVPYNPERFITIMELRRNARQQVFTGAYMVRCDCQKAGKTKAHYLDEKVFRPLWHYRALVMPGKGDRLADFYNRLMEYYGMGSFMAGQVIADVKNTPGQLLAKAPDWWKWAASGPGSRRGLNRVMDRSVKASWTEAGWLECLQELQLELHPLLKQANMPRMCAQDTQNCLCEFDKYERVRLGQGKPRALYAGT